MIGPQPMYFGKRLLAWVDRLGSVRANRSGQTFAYYPWGEERTSTPDDQDKFATYFRDGFGEDYARARYYNSNFGRFWSPDPGWMKAAKLSNPTSLNRYTYSLNDPINFYDPVGRDPCDDPAADGEDPCSADDGGRGGGGSGGGDACSASSDPPCYSVTGTAPTPPDPNPTNPPPEGPGPGDPGSPVSTPPLPPQCNTSNPLNALALSWISAHGADAAAAANKIGSTESIILSLSAIESGWGGGPFVVNGYNNYFSQHAPAPGSNGSVTLDGNYMATYASYKASALGFDASASGQLIANVTNAATAAADLQNAGYYGINRDGSKVPGFVSSVSDTASFIAARLNCPNLQ